MHGRGELACFLNRAYGPDRLILPDVDALFVPPWFLCLMFGSGLKGWSTVHAYVYWFVIDP